MSEKGNNELRVYYIPDNFIGESRILGGRINVRYLFDAVVLAALFFLLLGAPIALLAMKNAPTQYRIGVAIISAAPGIMLGMAGFNGDPFSVFLVNVFSWLKQSAVRIYNENPRRLGTDPVKASYEARKRMDKFVTMVEDYQQARIDKKNAEEFIEGKTFNFQYDPSIDGYLKDTGDYTDDAIGSGDYWPVADIEIESGSDLDGLESLLNSDWYNELATSSERNNGASDAAEGEE